MKKIFKRGMSGLLAVLMAFTVLAGFGTTTAFAASETAESYMISFPRDGDAAQIYSEDAWGHSAKTYMNGWATGSSNYTTLHCMDSFDGKVCYCIEPGLSRNVGDTYHGFGEDFWDNYPSQYNNTIEPDDIKLLLGRIMQYGYQGNLSTSWRSQNDSDADKLAHAFAVPFPVSWTVKMKKKQKETQDILSYHSQAAGCSDKARAKASGGRQPIEECGRTGL